ncbi:MAG: hypothetical protein J6C87_04015 [Bacteroides sp.]|nr:hypothetical protein [Bacteroides sp.]
MKINRILLAAATILLVGCDDDWNQDKLDGFGDFQITDVKQLEYTLTDADYKTIANNSTNKSLASAAGLSSELAALTGNKYFTDDIPASTYVPAFLAATYPTADNESAIKVTYNKLVGEPEYLSDIATASVYKVSDDDYTSVWESKNINASYLTPKTLSKVSSILKKAKPDAQAGDVVMVNYNYAQTEPSYSTPDSGDGVDVAGAWEPLTIPTYGTGEDWNFVNSGDIDLSAYAGKNVQVAFRYISDGTNDATATWEIKNLLVEAAGNTLLEESFSASLGDFTSEETLPEGLSYVWSFASYGYAKASAYAGGTRYETDAYLVSPAFAVTTGTTLSFDHVHRYMNNEVSDHLQLCIREVVKASTENAKVDAYQKVTNFAGEGKYIIAAVVDGAINAATPLEGKNYGYLAVTALEASNDRIIADETSNAVAWTIAKSDAGYTLLGSDGRYAYQSGTYNSFNFKNEYAAESGYDWAIEALGDGTFKLFNTSVEKSIQYDATYSSYGSYADERGVAPSLYKYVPAATKASTRGSQPTVPYNAAALYVFNGSAWSEYEESNVNVVALNPEVYNNLGKEYVSNPEAVLPTYLANYYPYAEEDEVMAVAYLTSATTVAAKELTLIAGEWVMTTETEQVTDQFVKVNGAWNYNPSVTINLLTKGDLTTLYYQTAVDWAWNNVDVPMGCTAKGQGYVTSYGNNDYYSGVSAYYGNVDWRASAAKSQYPTEYESMADDAIVALMQERFIEVMKPTLEAIHPEAKPVEGVTVTYTLNFIVYSGSNSTWTIQYEVTAPGTFQYVDGSLKKAE